MQRDLISKKTRTEFREYFSREYVLRQITDEFDSADVPFDPKYEPELTGQRRSLVERYYHSIDFSNWRDVRKVLAVFEIVLSHLEHESQPGSSFTGVLPAAESFKSLKKWIERDGFVYQQGTLRPSDKHSSLPDISEAVKLFDAPELNIQIERMQNSVEDDPALAIGTAKELVETTCKTILRDLGVSVNEKDDIIDLVKSTRKSLGLIPENISNAAKGADSIRRLVSNLGTIVQSLGELRNLYGTGHGREGNSRGLSPRHARLAVGASATLATFFFETHEERKSISARNSEISVE